MIDREREQPKMIMMRPMAARWAWAAVAGSLKIIDRLLKPALLGLARLNGWPVRTGNSILELHQSWSFTTARRATEGLSPRQSSPLQAIGWEVANGSSHRQRTIPQRRCRPQHPAPVGVAGADRPYRNQIRLRHRPVRRLHRAHGRRGHALVLGAGERGGRQADHHD